ncbi:hypothetical protein ACQB60_29570 [Actinomycetota bacterium Odt1-20B]
MDGARPGERIAPVGEGEVGESEVGVGFVDEPSQLDEPGDSEESGA